MTQTVTNKVGKSKGEYRENRRPWYNKEVKAKIGKRREWNGQHRWAQKGGDPQSHAMTIGNATRNRETE